MMAVNWANKGAQRLHVIDLDGARYGQLTNVSLMEKMVKKVNIPIQVGGGIRNYEEVKMLIKLGVDRIVLGTILWKDKELAGKLFQEFPKTIIAGIDAKEGKVAIEGWQNTTSVDAFEFAVEMEKLGAKRIIYTDIKRDGMMMGPNVANIEKMLSQINIYLIASGGIASLNDIKDLMKFRDKGLEGIIIGRALYNGAVVLGDAIKSALSE